ncbi:MAG: DNA internalization-related competence protein ComEC/Rec2 [Ruminococcaceae bacterium]|nr:DNA internalization-related competence protein ComEC/Rec2 [Oscillospiraceae bacterium]
MRRLMWFSIGFAAACMAGAFLYQQWLVLGAVIILTAAGILALVHKKYGNCLLPLLILLGLGIGLGWFCAYDYLFVTLPRAADGKQLNVSIEATEYSYETDYGSAVEGTVILNDKSYRVKAYLHTSEQISPGDTVTGRIRFRLTTSGGLEDPTSHRTEGIFLLAYPIGSSQIQHTDDISWRHYPAVWRKGLLTRIQELLPGEAGAFASALLLGERSGITYEMDTSFKVSGISHIIAVSGLHVSIVFGLIYTLLAKKRLLSCLIGIPALLLFAAIAGFTPSITRACIMQSLMLLALTLDREYDGPTALAFAVLVMLAANPLTILSVSFQLSVCCMIGIFLFSEKIREYLLRIGKGFIYKEQKLMNRLWQGIAASVSASLSATVMTMPLVAYYFGCVSTVSVLTNLLTLWVISFIFYGLIACLVVSAVSLALGKLLAVIVYVPIVFILKTAELLSKLPMSAMYTSNPYAVAWLVGIYIMLAIFLLQKKKQPKLLVVSVIFTFLLAQTFSWFEPLNDDFRVTMLDVGQGQSILLQSEGKTFLVDCGGDDSEDAADTTAEALLSQGVCRLDGIVVTHFDKDHVGGVVHLLSRIQTDRLILPDVEDEEQIGRTLSSATDATVEYIREDTLYTFGKAEMTIFAPISSDSDNERCICILFQRENCGILITGDRGISGEMALLQTHAIPEVDVLVAGHHGSSGSTSEALLEATSPQIALISVGEDNQYGHPSAAVLQRLTDAGCKIYRTDIYGTIIFRR